MTPVWKCGVILCDNYNLSLSGAVRVGSWLSGLC